MRRPLRILFLLLLVAVGCSVAMWIVGASVRPDLSNRPLPYTPEQVAEALKARDVHFDPAHTPPYYLDTHVTPKNESPILADLVKQGEIPPLAERMPKDPVVIEGPEGIGKYGGTWMRLATNATTDVDTINF